MCWCSPNDIMIRFACQNIDSMSSILLIPCCSCGIATYYSQRLYRDKTLAPHAGTTIKMREISTYLPLQ